MSKKILYSVLVVVIVVGAGYSYKKVDFGRKTTIFFEMNFGDGGATGRSPGAPGGMKREPRPGRERGLRPPNMEGSSARPPMGRGGEEASGRAGLPPGSQPGDEGDFRRAQGKKMPPGGGGPRGNMSMWRNPRTGEIISVREVIPYSFILAFFVMITRFLDLFCRKVFRSRPST
jgi:hypothetical protein